MAIEIVSFPIQHADFAMVMWLFTRGYLSPNIRPTLFCSPCYPHGKVEACKTWVHNVPFCRPLSDQRKDYFQCCGVLTCTSRPSRWFFHDFPSIHQYFPDDFSMIFPFFPLLTSWIFLVKCLPGHHLELGFVTSGDGSLGTAHDRGVRGPSVEERNVLLVGSQPFPGLWIQVLYIHLCVCIYIYII